MRQYRVEQVTRLSSGRVALNNEQARARKHRLEHVRGEVYEIRSTIEFKAGEEIGYDQPVPKALRDRMVPLDDAGDEEASGAGEEATDDEVGEDSDGDEADPADRLTPLGGGWYELPNGERHRGQEAAIQRLQALDAE